MEWIKKKFALFGISSAPLGITMLETAWVLFIFLLLFTAGAAVFDYVYSSMKMSEVVDRYVYDLAVKPYAIDAQTASLVVREDRLADRMKALTLAAEDDFNKSIGGAADKQRIYFEGQFAVINIDPRSGRATGWSPITKTKFSAGNFAPAAATLAEFSLEAAFKAEANSGSAVSIHALPNASMQRGGAGTQSLYLSQSFLIGIRAFYSFENTFTGKFIKELGIADPPVAASLKVVALRGEVE